MIEVLAPAGNIDALHSAVASGANAVYLGLDKFNARMKADNFTLDNIKKYVDFCHLYDVKVYVTINISIKQCELAELEDMVIGCEKAGVDALIVSDLAIVPIAKRLAPHIQLHASTQLGVHNALGAKYLERLGFTRVVLARECKVADIVDIKAHTSLEVEYFVHGAMCVSFSGGCLFSSIANGNSGNRGQCLQLCRKEYTETLTGSKGYMLSPKDQCLIQNIPDLINAGVDSLKIEGRMKSPEYVGLVVSKYRKMIDKHSISDKDMSDMKRSFNRGGFSKGYAFDSKKNIMCKSVQGHIGETVAKVIKVDKVKDHYKVTVKSQHNFINGDGVKVFREGAEVGGFEICLIDQNKDKYILYSKARFEVGDILHLTTDKALRERTLAVDLPKIPISIYGSMGSESGIHLVITVKDIQVKYDDPTELAQAKNQALDMESLTNQLSKLGDTPFVLQKNNIQILDDIFMSKSAINAMRRGLVESMLAELNKDRRRMVDYTNALSKYKLKYKPMSSLILCNPSGISKEDLESSGADIVVDLDKIQSFIMKYPLIENNLYVKLPKMQFTEDIWHINELLDEVPKNIGIYAENIYALEIAYERGLSVIGGIGLNIYNSEMASVCGLTNYIASAELNSDEINDMQKDNNCIGVYAYGKLPVMTFAHCPIQNITGCDCKTCLYKPFYLKDKYGEYYIDRQKSVNCSFTMYNSSCHNLSGNIQLDGYSKLIDFSISSQNEREVLRAFIEGNKIKLGEKYTDGHISRGVK